MPYVPFLPPLVDLPDDPANRWFMTEEVVRVRCTVCFSLAAILRTDGLLDFVGHPCGQGLDFDALRPQIEKAVEVWRAEDKVQKLMATPPHPVR